ncbi:MAG: DNA gyrase inhibitor YacG [Sedimentisphaerales bacterium]|nr:DNA gyrase inhibitor YacG [Sedimentisphaerales bacterium]
MKSHRCPICRRKLPGASVETSAYFPFCSQRCQQVDLGLWLSDHYAIPGRSIESDDLPPAGPADESPEHP